MDFKNIPIIIQNRDRVSCLKEQIEAFEKRGYKNIHIVDVASTYIPLLEYYKTLPHEIIYYPTNEHGHTTFVNAGIVQQFSHDWYAYTDPDIIPCEDCPDDFMEFFWNLLQYSPDLLKAGFSLKIDDIPEHYEPKQELVGWEKQYWVNKLPSLNAYLAPIDTTFALCRPGTSPIWAWAARSGSPYVARHSSWYLDLKNLPEEEIYYYKHIKQGDTHWSQINSSRSLPGAPVISDLY